MNIFSRLRSPGPGSGPGSSPAASDPDAPAGAGMRTIRALVSGQVQGVGFRWYCTEEAQRLGLVGRVSNLPDGDVKVLAQGPADAVSQLVAWLHHGSRWARVDDVRITELPPGSLTQSDFRPGN